MKSDQTVFCNLRGYNLARRSIYLLKARAKELDVEKYYDMDKNELIDAIRKKNGNFGDVKPSNRYPDDLKEREEKEKDAKKANEQKEKKSDKKETNKKNKNKQPKKESQGWFTM